MNDLKLTIGWFAMWLIAIATGPKWMSLHEFLVYNNFRKIGRGVYVRIIPSSQD